MLLGVFKLALMFDEEYPTKPPKVKFVSKMFHPNGTLFCLSSHIMDNYSVFCLVYGDGSLCLDILTNRWSPTYDVAAILTSIQSLLHDPNPNSPANAQAAQLYTENRREYTKKVREIVEASLYD